MKNSELNDLISVIMPVYNGEKYLKDAIDSILNQEYGNFELIIIDDGSTDQSSSIIKTYQDNRIVLIQNEKNMGISASLNKAIHVAKGEYIARIDCDDIANPKRLKLQLKYMKKNNHVGVCGSWVKYFGLKNGLMTYPISSCHIKAFLNFRNAFAHPSVMFRKSHFLQYGLRYNENSIIEDYRLWVDCSKKTEFHNIPRLLTYYRIVETSLSHNPIKQKQLQQAYYGLIKDVLLSNFGLDITERQLLLHAGDYESIKKEGISISEVYNWLNYLDNVNKIKRVYPYHAMKAMLSYRWYEICSAHNFKGIIVFFIYLFSKYNGLIYRPWHAIKLFISCIRKNKGVIYEK